MEVKLFWSFDSRMNLYGATEYMYDLYRASMLRAKNLGYEINFYGDDVAINKFQGYVDNFYDITPIHFEIVDDLKLYIHTQHDLDCVTIDGDLILHERLVFPDPENNKLYFDFPETNKDILKEENNKYNGYGDLKRIFEKYNTKYFFPHFNYNNDIACNTGLIKFNDQKIKDLFIHEFKGVNSYFVKHIEPFEKENVDAMRKIRFIIAQYHFGCLIRSLDVPTVFLKENNNYVHLFGNEKFYDHNKEMIYNILKNI